MKQNVIIFDFDGTIADSFDFVTGLLIDQAGKSPLTLAERQKLFGGMSIRAMADKLGISLPKKVWLFLHGRREMTKHIAEIRPFPGIETVIKTLHARGYHIFAVSSNRNENIRIFLRQHGLSQYFAGTLGSASIVGKTMALRILLWQREVRAENCTYIGDEVGDMSAANRLHIRTVAVSWGFNSVSDLKSKKPHAVVKTPKEILKIFDVQ